MPYQAPSNPQSFIRVPGLVTLILLFGPSGFVLEGEQRCSKPELEVSLTEPSLRNR
jgi:hypothetical protein